MKLNKLALILFTLKSTNAFSNKEIKSYEDEKANNLVSDSFHQNASSRNLMMEGQFEQIGNSIVGDDPVDFFGYRVDLSSDGLTVAVAGTLMDGTNGKNQGKVRIFSYSYSSESWEKIGQDIEGGSKFAEAGVGLSLSSDGRTVVVGAPYADKFGEVHVYSYYPFQRQWNQIGQTLSGGEKESAGDVTEEYGWAVDLSDDGHIIAIGAPLYYEKNDDEYDGKVEVYEWDGTNWTQKGSTLYTSADCEDQFGAAVGLSYDGKILAVGSLYGLLGDNGGYGGDVQVFQWNSSSQEYEPFGSRIVAEANYDAFGYSLGLSKNGKHLVVGGYKNDNGGNDDELDIGHVRVFEYKGGDWKQVGQDINGEAVGDYFGGAVAISHDGRTIVVGGEENDGNGYNAGHSRVYSWSDMSDEWVKVGTDLDGEDPKDYFGWDVSISGNGQIVAIGGPDNKGANNAGSRTGHVRVFKYKKSDPEVCYGEFQSSSMRIKLVLRKEQACLEISKKKKLLLKPCKSTSFQKWNVHTLGLIRSEKYPSFCMQASGVKVKMVNCESGNPSSWVFNADGSATSGTSVINKLNGTKRNNKWKISMAKVANGAWSLKAM
mmetsp:Transcript_12670/g.18068  ORF Transcript_12670/g.18068 Transcript_12670/m.18068 type:complete len:599 (+) Transcript_12670:117-1913(+)|eukprot:CAMPEP_0184867098 /NCGR_PEP_ID=MMETSP0580-20130426/25043_1 /TAXON_ID=1118495 /ORGANISM="Dactyliosolen fragilissimus" /LENGTH=598 /DNA_ID=CAMNT_0027367147 /DNA_START=112 /DNA_END=1908 /DNA_ORIENTATION=-